MNKEFQKLIDIYSHIFDEIYRMTKIGLTYAQNNNYESIYEMINNRDRLIKVLGNFQHKIEKESSKLNLFENNSPDLVYLKKAQSHINKIVTDTQELETKLIHILENEKVDLVNSIAGLFLNKEKLRGYNLNNLK